MIHAIHMAMAATRKQGNSSKLPGAEPNIMAEVTRLGALKSDG
jgi:hypothetical protein